MNHPYKDLEKTKLWVKIEKALNDLEENKDVEIKTRPEYVIGFLCKELLNLEKKEVKGDIYDK